ncbi:MAG: chloromuconate cycloisomerase [Firmicutes bacterium]|nr:chloromuconate cycloisomerase [Bacillota bacterium]
MARIKSFKTMLLQRSTIVLATAYGRPAQTKEHVFVILEDEDGVCGWGESTPLTKFTGETTHSVRLLLEEELLPAIVGMDSFNIAAIHRVMDRALYGNTSAKMAIDTALYDLNAKAMDVPLYQLLGGCVRKTVMINRHLGIMSVEEAVEKARGYVQDGFKSIKMKVGNHPDEDINRVQAVRDAVGTDIHMRIDANGSYTYPQALRVARALADVNLEMFEQPLPKWDVDAMVDLRKIVNMPLGADESITSVQEAMIMAQRGAADVFTIKLVKIGGLYPALQVAGIARAANISCIVAATYDTQVNTAHCLHLACALPGEIIPCDLTCYATQPTQADTCHILKDGMLTVGTEPGCGVRSLIELGNLADIRP